MKTSLVAVLIPSILTAPLFGEADPIVGEQGDMFVGISHGFDFPTYHTTPLTVGIYLFDGISLGLEYGIPGHIEANDEKAFGFFFDSLFD